MLMLGYVGPTSAQASVTRLRSRPPATPTVTPLESPRGRAGGERRPSLPEPRGPLSLALVESLSGLPGTMGDFLAGQPMIDDALSGEDAPLALYVLYELSYRGFAGVDAEWEWDLDAIRLRTRLEGALIARLRKLTSASFGSQPVAPGDVRAELRRLAEAEGPSLSAYMSE